MDCEGVPLKRRWKVHRAIEWEENERARGEIGGPVSQRFPGNDGLLLSLQPLHFQHRVQAAVRLPVRTSNPICPSEVLAIVHGEIQMVQGMMCRPIDNVLQPVAGDHIRIVNENRPYVHADEECEVEVFLNGEDVGKDVVGERLEVTVDWVESVGGEGGGNDPLVVWLVDVLVDEGVVFQSVDPVDAVIGAEEEPVDRTSV